MEPGLQNAYQIQKAASHVQHLELCNDLNITNYLVTSYVTGDTLSFDCIVNYCDGVPRETFIRTCRQFTRNIENGLAKFDIDNISVLPPEKPEAEEVP